MDYECRIVSASKLHSGNMKVMKPLCTSCVNKNCTNSIVDNKVSIRGIIHTSRLYSSGSRLFFVLDCDGFRKKDDDYEV